jgi:hypothetical protein
VPPLAAISTRGAVTLVEQPCRHRDDERALAAWTVEVWCSGWKVSGATGLGYPGNSDTTPVDESVRGCKAIVPWSVGTWYSAPVSGGVT